DRHGRSEGSLLQPRPLRPGLTLMVAARPDGSPVAPRCRVCAGGGLGPRTQGCRRHRLTLARGAPGRGRRSPRRGEGDRVVVAYASNRAGAEEVAAACSGAGGEAIVVAADVAKDEHCRRLVLAAVDTWGRLDVLVNNAAVTKTIPHQRLDLLDAEEFERNFAVNLIGNY